MLKAVLFDLDGVLVDTEGIYTDFWNEINRIYPTGVENFAQVIKGNTLAKILTTYFPEEAVQGKICEMLVEHERNMKYCLFPGALDFIKKLRDKGIKTAIVTSSNHRKMKNLFGQLPELEAVTDVLVTDEDVTASKPDPQGYLLAAEKLGAGNGEFAVVEDSLAGLEAGRRSGAIVVGLATTNPSEKIAPLADIVVDSIKNLSYAILLR